MRGHHSVRQEYTSRSHCEVEVRATDEQCTKEVLSIRLRGKDISLGDDLSSTQVYNDNQGCVAWSKTTMTSDMKHIDLSTPMPSVRVSILVIFPSIIFLESSIVPTFLLKS